MRAALLLGIIAPAASLLYFRDGQTLAATLFAVAASIYWLTVAVVGLAHMFASEGVRGA